MAGPDQPPLTPGAGIRPVRSREDVLKQFSPEVLAEENAPVRDAIADALTGLLFACESWAEYACAQADVLRSTKGYLDAGGDDREIHRASGEEDEEYRERIFEDPPTVTLKAVRDEVNALLAPHTASQCQVFEAALDRWFLTDGDQGWHSFPDHTPDYPDRLYERDAPLNGGGIPNSDPGGTWVFDDCHGRHFVVRIPDLSGLNDLPTFLMTGEAEGSPPYALETFGFGFFPGDGSDPVIAAYMQNDSQTTATLYAAICRKIDQLAGQSMRWSLWTDTRL